MRHRQPVQIQSFRVNSEFRSSFLKMIVFHMARWKVGDQIIIAQSGARPVLLPASAPRGPSICHYDLEIGLVASSSPAHVSPVAGIFHSNYSGSLAPRNHLVILGWAAVVDQLTGAWRFQPQLELARFAELFRPLAGCLEKRVQIVASQGNGRTRKYRRLVGSSTTCGSHSRRSCAMRCGALFRQEEGESHVHAHRKAGSSRIPFPLEISALPPDELDKYPFESRPPLNHHHRRRPHPLVRQDDDRPLFERLLL